MTTPASTEALAERLEADGEQSHCDAPSLRVLTVGGVQTEGRVINLRDLGFVGTVSDEARAEIAANERRAARVLHTAHLYWFGGSQ